MSNFLLGASTWTFNGLLPQELMSIVDGKSPCPPNYLQAVHTYFVELATAIIHSKIEAVELWYSRIMHDPLVYEQLSRLASAQKIASMHAPFVAGLSISSEDSKIRASGVMACISAAKLLSNLGGERIVVHGSNCMEDCSDMPARAKRCVASLTEIADACSELGIQVALELLPTGMVGSSSPELIAIMDMVDRPNVGVCLDVNHVFPSRHLIPTIYSLADRIINVHISDYDGSEERHRLPGLGIIDWPDLLRALSQVGYSGPLIYEARFEAADINDAVYVVEKNYKEMLSLSSVAI